MTNNVRCLILSVLIVLSGCDKTPHGLPSDLPEDTGVVVSIGLNTEHVTGLPLTDIHLFWFDQTDRLIRHDFYNSMQELGLARVTLAEGSYTIIAVLNTGSDFTPPVSRSAQPDTDLAKFAIWIKTQTGIYPDMLTGTLRHVMENGIELVYIDLEPKDEGIKTTNVALSLIFPFPRLPDYAPTRATTVPTLRGVVEIYQKGTSERLFTRRAMLVATEQENCYHFDLSLGVGEYDMDIWVDYTTEASTDNHYITTDLNPVRVLPRESYRANTDTRDAFARHITLNVTGEYVTEVVTMYRPLAKYRLVTTDVAKYNELRPKQDWPPLEDLNIEIAYEGFWPNAYSVPNAAPAGAEGGYSYTSAWSEQSETEATAGKDYVFVNGTESFVRVNITFRDSNGKVVSSIGNVQVNYRIGCLTTVQGNFLTASTGGGIHIDTEWSGEYEVEF